MGTCCSKEHEGRRDPQEQVLSANLNRKEDALEERAGKPDLPPEKEETNGDLKAAADQDPVQAAKAEPSADMEEETEEDKKFAAEAMTIRSHKSGVNVRGKWWKKE